MPERLIKNSTMYHIINIFITPCSIWKSPYIQNCSLELLRNMTVIKMHCVCISSKNKCILQCENSKQKKYIHTSVYVVTFTTLMINTDLLSAIIFFHGLVLGVVWFKI